MAGRDWFDRLNELCQPWFDRAKQWCQPWYDRARQWCQPWYDRARQLYIISSDIVKRKARGRFVRKNFTYFRIHLTYFIVLAMVGTLILREIGLTHGRFKWIDALYCFSSAICLSGLSTVPIENMRKGGHVVLLFGMILGGQVVTSIVPLLVKKHRYLKVVRQIVENPSERDESGSGAGNVRKRRFSRSEPNEPVGEKGSSFAKLKRMSTSILVRSEEDRWMEEMAVKHDPVVEGGSLREVLLEYRANTLLIKLVVFYYVVVQLVGFIIAWISIAASPHAKRVLKAKRVNTGFYALFVIVSGFANCGYVLSNENMVALNTSSLLLMDIFVVVLLGNTLYAPALRFVVWTMYKHSNGRSKEACKFLLDNPRRCYTHLFPWPTTRWLSLVVAVLISFQALMFFILDWNGKALQGMHAGHKIVVGLFDASGTRTSGMNSVNLMDVSPAILLLYCSMMYISAYPVFLSRQNTRVRAESEKDLVKHAASLGSLGDLHDITISTQSRRLLARDWMYLFFALFFICIAENKKLERDPINFSIFSIIFEIISAYGSVGLSLRYSCSLRIQSGPCTDVPYSFSGKWNYISKVIIIVVMFLGRHRGLPDNIDSAIILPDRKFSTLMIVRPSSSRLDEDEHSYEHELPYETEQHMDDSIVKHERQHDRRKHEHEHERQHEGRQHDEHEQERRQEQRHGEWQRHEHERREHEPHERREHEHEQEHEHREHHRHAYIIEEDWQHSKKASIRENQQQQEQLEDDARQQQTQRQDDAEHERESQQHHILDVLERQTGEF